MTIHPLDGKETPLEAFLLIKVLDDEGHPVWSFRTTNAFNEEELLGALTVQVELLRRKLAADWDDD